MAKNCSKAVYEQKIKESTSSVGRLQIKVKLYWILFKINLYQMFLMAKEWIYGVESGIKQLN